MITAEVALSFVLLVGGGLMARSFITLARTDPGFDPSGVLTFSVPGGGGQTPDQAQAFVTQLRTRLLALPGVQAVTAASPLPLDGGIGQARIGTEEAANDPSKFQQTNIHVILPGYFAAMRTRVIAGRVFTDDDNRPDFLGVVIDNLLAAKFFPGQNPIGRRLLVRARGADAEWVNVIGVVAHQRHTSLAVEGREAIFFPDRYFGPGSVSRWAVRIDCTARRRCDPTEIATAARQVVTDLDPLMPVAELKPMSAFVDRAMSGTRFSLVLISVFAGVAAILACVGLYGVLSTAVRQRTAEIGVRMTYGATSRSIFRLVIGDGMRLSSIGRAIGLAAAFALTRVMRSMLVGVSPADPPTYAAIVALFIVITVLAC